MLAGQRVVAALKVARGLVIEIGVEGPAAQCSSSWLARCSAGSCLGQRKGVGRPFPDVADQLMHAAHADAAGKLVDADRAARARAPQVGPAAVHGFAPRIAALQQRMAGDATPANCRL